MKIFIGCIDKSGAEQKLIRSIERNCRGTIHITMLRQQDIGSAKFVVPQECGYKGRAIYIQSDYVLRGDLHDLLDIIPRNGLALHPLIAYRTEVLVFDCQNFSLQWWPGWDELGSWTEKDYIAELMKNQKICFGRWPEWNRDRLTEDAKLYCASER